MAAIHQSGHDVGYCKPVGQQFVDLGELKVDKDALLFAKTMDFQLNAEWHSPVIIGKGVTTAYLKNPGKFQFREAIETASRELQQRHDFVVYEGTGHPGVGSIVDLSNADVAHLLGAPVVMIVEGGIGSTIDQLNLNLALFRERGVPIVGVIINKVIPDKLAKVQRLVGGYLKRHGTRLLGVIPYDQYLSNPIMESIRQAVRGRVLANELFLDNRVEHIASGSLIARKEVAHWENMLVIVNHRKMDEAITTLQQLAEKRGLDYNPVSGIVVNGEDDFMTELEAALTEHPYIQENHIPVVATHLDTYGAAVKISQMEVKINIRTPWKAIRAIELIKENVKLPGFVE
jgi:dethiobiotin synthetase